MASMVAQRVCADEELLLEEQPSLRKTEDVAQSCSASIPGSSSLWASIAGLSTLALAGTCYSKVVTGPPALGAVAAVDAQSFQSKKSIAALQSLQEVKALSGASSSSDMITMLLGAGCCRPFDKLFEQTELGDSHTKDTCEEACHSQEGCDAFAISGCHDGVDGSCTGMCHTYHLTDDATWITDGCIDPELDGNTYCYYMEVPEVQVPEPETEDRDSCLPDLWWIQDFEAVVIAFPWWFDASKMPSDLVKECPHVFGSQFVALNKPLASTIYSGTTFTQVQVVPHSVEPVGNPTAGKPSLPADEASACQQKWMYTDFPVLEGKDFCDDEYVKLPTHCNPCSLS